MLRRYLSPRMQAAERNRQHPSPFSVAKRVMVSAMSAPPPTDADTRANSTACRSRHRLLVLDAAYTLEAIRERGNECTILCRDLDGYFDHVWSVHPFATLLTSATWASRFGKPVWHDLAPRHTFIEAKVGRFEFLRHVFPLNFAASQALLFVELLRLIRREHIDVIRVGDPLYLGLLGLGLSRLTRVPLVIRVNGNSDKVRENTGKPLYPRLLRSIALEKLLERLILPRADLVAALNQENLEFAVANGARPDRVTLFRLGNLLAEEHLRDPAEREYDPALFAKLGIKPRNYLLCVGRLNPVKYPDDAVRVLAEIRRRGFDQKLVFAGDGESRLELAALAEGEGVRSHVVFAGNQNQRALSQLNPCAAVVLSPLTGRALSESALGSAPIVAYDLDWQAELVETGVTGELVPFREWREMANSVEKYLRDPDYAVAMGRGARARAREILDPGVLNEHERRTYAQLLRRFDHERAHRTRQSSPN